MERGVKTVALYNNMIDFYKVLIKDEPLMRLLYYPAKNTTDDPLSKSKPNLIDTDIYRNDILKQRILRAPNADGLVENNEGICRICMYMGTSTRTENIYMFNQRIVFDIFVNIQKYEMVDSRSMRIIDRLNEIVNDEPVTGMGACTNVTFAPITAPVGYIGYTSEFMFGSTK